MLNDSMDPTLILTMSAQAGLSFVLVLVDGDHMNVSMSLFDNVVDIN